MKNQIFKQIVSLIAGFSLVFAGVMPATAAGTAKLFFDPSVKTVGPGETFSLDIMVDTGADKTLGVDAILQWDSSKLDYVGYEPNLSTDPLPSVVESTAGAYTNRKVVSALVGLNASPVGGNGTAIKVATVNFKAKTETGATNVNFVFDPQNPNDTTNNYCNVTSSTGSELLNSVESATVTVSSTPPATTDPDITSISPSSGTNTSSHDITIFGTNFGATQGTGWVHIGTKSATVTSWSDTSISVTIPAEPDLTANSARRITVTRDDDKSDTYDSFTYIVGSSPAPLPPGSGGIEITYIYPASGSKMVPTNITIYGRGFGFYGENSKVYIGLEEMTNILDWNDDRILLQVPPRPELTSKTTLGVKVYNNDQEMDEYFGYTYFMSPLPGTGPEEWMWASIVAAALAGAWLVYRKLNQPIEVVDERSDYQF
ncbi:hypothetical protein DRH29_01740 [candidate division Kazan bacterium]|uniref:IPT/TIG domain-containing protein n=1 Tax=candidate division Kazan bacterium TaxID=2202143 RepID=A0A420ZD92_UNCK3|nr:MAG: hypothetical protein DRH29_01740 [candidate division Kazan bacterium]